MRDKFSDSNTLEPKDTETERDRKMVRLDVLVEKGSEELLPEELYNMLPGHGLWVEDKGEDVIIRAYTTDISVFVEYLQKLDIKIKNVAVAEEQPVDYSELTKKYFRPIKIEDVTILASWHKKDKNRECIVIEPGMAFGTGRHESTRLMFKLMSETDMKGKSALDIGCGSGILSLYANHLGVKKAVAVDNDMDAVESAKKNLELNNADNIELICTDIGKITGLYDVILANLDIQTFKRYASHIKKLLSNGGIVLISGVLSKNKKDVTTFFYPLSLVRLVKKNSWCGFVFKKSVQAV